VKKKNVKKIEEAEDEQEECKSSLVVD